MHYACITGLTNRILQIWITSSSNAADTLDFITVLVNNTAVIGPPDLFDLVPGPRSRTGAEKQDKR